jgi:hypothetical protein
VAQTAVKANPYRSGGGGGLGGGDLGGVAGAAAAAQHAQTDASRWGGDGIRSTSLAPLDSPAGKAAAARASKGGGSPAGATVHHPQANASLGDDVGVTSPPFSSSLPPLPPTLRERHLEPFFPTSLPPLPQSLEHHLEAASPAPARTRSPKTVMRATARKRTAKVMAPPPPVVVRGGRVPGGVRGGRPPRVLPTPVASSFSSSSSSTPPPPPRPSTPTSSTRGVRKGRGLRGSPEPAQGFGGVELARNTPGNATTAATAASAGAAATAPATTTAASTASSGAAAVDHTTAAAAQGPTSVFVRNVPASSDAVGRCVLNAVGPTA